jgi:hypothetical protein
VTKVLNVQERSYILNDLPADENILNVGLEVHCVVCLKMFWDRERVINHLRYRSKPCRDWHLQHTPHLSQNEADEIDASLAQHNRALQSGGQRRHKATKPCLQLQGPLPNLQIDANVQSSHHRLGKGHNYFI